MALVDDHRVVLDSIRPLIEHRTAFQVCGTAVDARSAMRLLADEDPDIMVVDIALPDRNGIDLIRDLLAYKPDLLVVCLSALDEMRYAKLALQAGARGYVSKCVGADTLIEALETVRSGGVHVSPSVNTEFLKGLVGMRPDVATESDPFKNLTSREFEVFNLIARGLSTGEIAQKLTLSPNTVQRHKENIKRKLDIKTPEQLIRKALEAFEDWLEAGQQ